MKYKTIQIGNSFSLLSLIKMCEELKIDISKTKIESKLVGDSVTTFLYVQE